MQTVKRMANTDQNLARRAIKEARVDIGIYGLGRMGGNMVTRLARGGHRVIAGNRSPEPVQEAIGHGAVGASSIEDMVRKLKPPRVLWSMVPAGDATDHTLDEFARFAPPGDVLVDGGNSNFRDSMKRAEKYTAKGLRFLDVGVSGGIWGLENGYCMMVGGPAGAVAVAKPIIEAINHDVPMTALAHSLFARFASRQDSSFAMKVAAALRNQFGGHALKKE